MKKIKQFLCGSSNIYETVKPFYYSLKLFGLASFQLNCKEKKLTMTFKDYLFLFCSIIFGMVAIYSTFFEIRSYLTEGTSLIENGWKYQYLYQIVITVPIMVFGYIKKKHVERFLRIVNSFDEHIEHSNWEHKVNHSQEKSKLLIWLATSAFIIIMIYCFSLFIGSYTVTYINILLNTFVVKLHEFVMYQFLFSVLCIKDRYKILNKNMR